MLLSLIYTLLPVLALIVPASVIIFVVDVPTVLPIFPLPLDKIKVEVNISGLDEFTSFTIFPLPLELKVTLVASAKLPPLITPAIIILVAQLEHLRLI